MNSPPNSAPDIRSWPSCNPVSIVRGSRSIMRPARIASRVQNDYIVAQQIEDKDRAVYLDEKNQAEGQNDKAVQYQVARQEATQSRNLYENLVSRMKEADVVAGMRSSNITLVDPARVPARPAKPNVLIYAAGSIAGGLLLGICGALFRDATDTRIQELGEMELLFGEAHRRLVALPRCESRTEAPGFRSELQDWRPPSPLRLILRRLRSLHPTRPSPPLNQGLPIRKRCACSARHLCRAAAMADRAARLSWSPVRFPERARACSAPTWRSFAAQRGKRVLLVDGDLRTPVLHHELNLQDYSRSQFAAFVRERR